MKQTLLTILLFCFLSTSSVLAQEINIKIPESANLKVESGETISFPILIETDTEGEYSAEFDLPDSWSLIGFDKDLYLEGDKRRLNLVTVSVPNGARSGDYDLSYSLDNKENPNISKSIRIPVHVKLRLELEITAEEGKGQVLTDENISTTFIVHNRSNTDEVVRLHLHDQFGRSTTDVDELEMEPNEVKTIDVITSLEGWDIQRKTDHHIKLEALSSRSDTIRAVHAVRREIYPTIEGAGLVYHEFPVEVSGSIGYENYDGDESWLYQFGIAGSGTYVENGDDGVSFEFIFPDQRDAYSTILPVYDRYSVNFWGENYKIDLGDQNFLTTPLMGYGFADFGVGAGAYYNDFGLYGYASKNRRFQLDTREIGGSFSYSPNDFAKSHASYKWVEADHGLGDGHVGVVGSKFRPTDNTTLSAEAGISDSELGTDYAGYFSTTYLDQQWRARFKAQHYGDNYLTYSRGLTSVDGGIDFLFCNWWKVFVSGSYHHRDQFSRYEYWNGRVGLGYKSISAFYSRSYRDRDNNGTFFKKFEDMVGARAAWRQGIFNGSLFSNYAVVTDEITDEKNDRVEAGATLSASPSEQLRLFSNASYEKGAQMHVTLANDEYERLNTGLGFDWNFISSTSILTQANVFYYNENNTYNRVDWRIRSSVEHRLPWDHSLELQGYYYDSGARNFDTYGAALTYVAPIGIPLHRSRLSGLVEGIIHDKQTGEGLANIPIFMGEAGVASNNDGTFYIPEQPPGVYTLNVDQLSLGLDYIVTNDEATRDIEVKPGEVTYVAIEAVQSAKIEGNVIIEKGDTYESVGEEEVIIEPLPNVVLELTGEDGFIRRRMSDPDGNVSFMSLPPGTYDINVLENYLPDLHKAKTSTQTVTVESGQVENVEFVIAPVKRKIQFVEQQETSVEVRKEAPTTATEALETGQYTTHTVKAGDWLSKLARRYYNDMDEWPLIFDVNTDKIADPDLIYVGQKLVIPVKATKEQKDTSYYKVKDGEWLYDIAREVYGNPFTAYKIIEANNIENPDDIVPGMVIVLPSTT